MAENCSDIGVGNLKRYFTKYYPQTGNTDIAKPGYEPLLDVLISALEQAQSGKGAERHANGLPFMEQPIMQEARLSGIGFLCGQARKKILEAKNCTDHDRAVRDLLGAINYTAAMVLLRREQLQSEL